MPRTATHLRNAEIATIKIMAKHLDMDDATYRAMLKRETGEVSAADLDWKGRKKVIDHLIALGAPKPPRKGKPGNFDQDVYYAKFEALLADMGASWAYAEAIVVRDYPRHKLAEDDVLNQIQPGQKIATPKLIKGTLVGTATKLNRVGLLEDLEQFERDTIVKISDVDKNRVNAILPPNIVNQFDVFAAAVEFIL